MCGIAGTFGAAAGQDEIDLVDAVVRSQLHRGPDNQAVVPVRGRQSSAVLGHNRLSIIDLSAEANQPMWDHDKRFCLVFNGEIYNYVELKAELEARGRTFRTRSDTEVLIEAVKEWGDSALERLNGMFAFALYDTAEDRLLLVRDRFGIKPLYYHASSDRITFASSGRVIAQRLGLQPDLEYVSIMVRYNHCDQKEMAPYAGLKSLRPGHFLSARLDPSGELQTEIKPWYDLTSRVEAAIDRYASIPQATLAEQVLETLTDAVDVRFRADVPIAVSLSGGLDSSSVAALSAARQKGDLTGFTFGHPQDPFSEGAVTQKLVDHLGIKVRWINPQMPEIVSAYFETIQAQDAPFHTGSAVGQYLVYKDVKSAGVRVLLGGQGADETFMGYRKFQLYQLARLNHQKDRIASLRFALSLAPLLAAEARQLPAYWAAFRRANSRSRRETALSLPELAPDISPVRRDEPVWRAQVRDVLETSLPLLLRFEDRNSMAHSIESRLPFMDYRMVELGIALPAAVKLRHGYGKWIVRQAMESRIPDAIRIARYKRGFDVEQNRWIDSGLGDAIRGALNERCARIKPFLKPGADSDTLYSNERLKQNFRAFGEATALLWLGDRA